MHRYSQQPYCHIQLIIYCHFTSYFEIRKFVISHASTTVEIFFKKNSRSALITEQTTLQLYHISIMFILSQPNKLHFTSNTLVAKIILLLHKRAAKNCATEATQIHHRDIPNQFKLYPLRNTKQIVFKTNTFKEMSTLHINSIKFNIEQMQYLLQTTFRKTTVVTSLLSCSRFDSY